MTAGAALVAAAPGPLAGLDPGRSKCGLVLTDPERLEIRQALVLPPEAAWRRLGLAPPQGPGGRGAR